MNAFRSFLRLPADESGQTTVEWALILLAFALPMFFIFVMLVDILAGHYQMVTFLETLPFP